MVDTVPILLLTRDASLSADVCRLAAAAGVPVDVVERPATGLSTWAGASSVLVGADAAAELAALGPPRRLDVHLLTSGPAADEAFRLAVALGAGSVLELPEAEPWLAALLADLGDRVLDRAGQPGAGGGPVVGVLGGSGGAGASVLAAALAATAGRGEPAALIDLDPLGPGAARLLGIDHVPGVTWSDLSGSRGRLGSQSLREALPRQGGVSVLGWRGAGERPHPDPVLLREVVAAAARGHGLVLIDLPRSSAGVVLDASLHCDRLVLVSRASVGHVAATARVAEVVGAGPAPVALVVRTHRGSASAAQVAQAVGLPLLAELPDHRRLDEHLDLGAGPVHRKRSPFARAIADLLPLLVA